MVILTVCLVLFLISSFLSRFVVSQYSMECDIWFSTRLVDLSVEGIDLLTHLVKEVVNLCSVITFK
jgi:hypothetical protein